MIGGLPIYAHAPEQKDLDRVYKKNVHAIDSSTSDS